MIDGTRSSDAQMIARSGTSFLIAASALALISIATTLPTAASAQELDLRSVMGFGPFYRSGPSANPSA